MNCRRMLLFTKPYEWIQIMTLTQAPLPYDRKALEPYMSANTLDFHHGKHHKTYVDNTTAAIHGTPLENAALEDVVKAASKSGDRKLFNNSAQAWNHEFFWRSMTPAGGPGPSAKLADWLKRDFGGIEQFKQAFKSEAVAHFASGWAWLIVRDHKLQVCSYHDADTPLVLGVVPLLTADLW
jgi:superoxide dismutase, Fe-Mn family